MATCGCFAAAEDLLPVLHRLRRDISAPARGLTGVRWVSAGWSEHVSVSRLVCLTRGRAYVRPPHCQRTHHKPDAHPYPPNPAGTVGGAA